MSLARRSITSVSWNMGANLVNVAVLFIRTVLLARWLPVDVFGVYAFASSVIGLTSVLPKFGMGGAFLHRTTETEDENLAASVHFTIKLLLTAIWAGCLAGWALLFLTGETRLALLVLTFTTGGLELTQTPRLILVRRVVHRRLAFIQIVNVTLTTVVAIGLSLRGATLWALLATDIVTFLLNVAALYIWRPVWRPRLKWQPDVVRYFLHFGGRNFLASALLKTLDRVDDLWTGIYLGKTDLGFYSKAYTFATYPRRILAAPINMVARGTYAELKENRNLLSQAFFRIIALLVRSGFLLAGLLFLVAPEFIRLLLGEKWLPMLDAFRLMLAFTLFDPIKVTISSLFIAVGHPEKVVWTRLLQLGILLTGLFVLGPRFGIAGVALAVDGMLVVGIVVLLWLARAYVDFSTGKLFFVPLAALAAGVLSGYGVSRFPAVKASDWTLGAAKSIVFVTVYGMILLALERQQLFGLINKVRQSLHAGDNIRTIG